MTDTCRRRRLPGRVKETLSTVKGFPANPSVRFSIRIGEEPDAHHRNERPFCLQPLRVNYIHGVYV
jgi:hypothetical protein